MQAFPRCIQFHIIQSVQPVQPIPQICLLVKCHQKHLNWTIFRNSFPYERPVMLHGELISETVLHEESNSRHSCNGEWSPEGLEPHACSSEKRNDSHTGCYGEVGEGGKPSAGGWLQMQELQNTFRGSPTLLPEAEYSTCLSDWCREVTEGGRGCEGRKRHRRIWHHTQQNTWIIHLSQRSSNSSTTSIVIYSQPCLLSYACGQILISGFVGYKVIFVKL